MKNKKILILTGKSGSGKDTVLNRLVDNYDFNRIISFTTRPMREGETNGKEYYFTSKEDFLGKVCDKEMIDFRAYSTLVNNKRDIWYYGTHKNLNNMKQYNNVVILDLEGAKSFVDYFGKDNCYIVYLNVIDYLRKERAKQRGSFDETEWNRRLQADNEDFSIDKVMDIADLLVVNANNEIDEVCKNIIKEMNKNER